MPKSELLTIRGLAQRRDLHTRRTEAGTHSVATGILLDRQTRSIESLLIKIPMQFLTKVVMNNPVLKERFEDKLVEPLAEGMVEVLDGVEELPLNYGMTKV